MRESDKDEIIRAAILKAAENLFQRWGLHKTTMEDIAREAGKGKSTLYYYYQSKEEIFDTVITTAIDSIINKAKDSTEGIPSAKGKIRNYIVTTLMELKHYGSAFTIVRTEIKRNTGFLEKLRKLYEFRIQGHIREILVLGMATNEYTFADENELTLAVTTTVGLLHAMELYLLLENDDSAVIEMAAKLIANGI
ncbi:MAG TPA: TetR/AcrR family transcriptional regulator [Bacteroidota bacterium]|nr:TetR/AcrR family transcriptional regulator [Bacteroidota bacterium]